MDIFNKLIIKKYFFVVEKRKFGHFCQIIRKFLCAISGGHKNEAARVGIFCELFKQDLKKKYLNDLISC